MLKKLKYLIPVVAALFFAGSVHAQTEYFTISNFNSDITVSEDGKVAVTENIGVDFTEPRHGVFRFIPYKYKAGLGTTLKVRYKVISVTDESGKAWKYEATSEGDNFKIKIGDPDSYVDGHQTYVIKYELERVINFFDEHDELYFNVTGNDWPVTITKVTAQVNLPAGISKEKIKVTAFRGLYGSTDPADFEVTAGNTVKFSAENLIPYEGLTAVVGWPKGIVEPPGTLKKIGWFLSDNWIFVAPVFLPILSFMIMLRLWRKYGRDPKRTGVLVTMFAPPDGMSPAEVGTIIDERADTRDVVASIIDLASRGYLRIVETEKDSFLGNSKEYTLIKLKGSDDKLRPFEKLIFDNLFESGMEVTKEDLENKYYKHLTEIKDSLYESLHSGGYFVANPEKTRKQYRNIGFLLVFGDLFLLWSGIGIFIWPITVGLLLSGVIVLIFSKFMPKKSDKGVKAYEHVLGFEEFMNTAEKYRQRFAENANMFTELLPYAIAFNVVDKWAGAFEGIYKGRPDWYESSGTFNAIYFAYAMNNFSSGFSTAMASSPRSSASGGGSGFSGGGSGGGFGGGGGGSW